MNRTAGLSCVAVLAVMLTGCSSQQTPTSVTQSFVHAVGAGDWNSVKQYEQNPDSTNPSTNNVAMQILKKDKFQVGAATVNGNSATVDVTVTAPDMTQVVRGMVANALANAFTGNTVDGSSNAVDQEFTNALNSSSLPTVTKDVQLNLIKTSGGQWKVSSNNAAFMDAATGNLSQLANVFSGSN